MASIIEYNGCPRTMGGINPYCLTDPPTQWKEAMIVSIYLMFVFYIGGLLEFVLSLCFFIILGLIYIPCGGNIMNTGLSSLHTYKRSKLRWSSIL